MEYVRHQLVPGERAAGTVDGWVPGPVLAGLMAAAAAS